jgi:hypothetical protein
MKNVNLVNKRSSKIGDFYRMIATSIVLFTTLSSFADLNKIYIPQETPNRKGFAKAVKAGDFKEALASWPTAFAQTKYSSTAEGRALYALLVFKSGLPTLGLEMLFEIPDLTNISSGLRAQWRKEAAPQHQAWEVVDVKWDEGSNALFPKVRGTKHLPSEVYIVNKEADLVSAKSTLLAQQKKKYFDESQEAFRAMQLGLWDAFFKKTDTGLALISRASEKSYSGVDPSRVHINTARVLYQRGKYNEALLSYDKVEKGSDYWIEAIEEKAWTHLKLDRPEQALAQLRSLNAPIFANQVGPEPFFLQALTNLRICAYPQVFGAIEQFKTTFQPRLSRLKELAKTGGTKEADEAVYRLVKGPYSLKSLGDKIGYLPRQFHRDLFIQKNVDRRRQFVEEALTAIELQNEGKFGPQASAWVTLAKSNAEASRINIFKRLKFLAEQELSEVKLILQKLAIVEAEVIQRVYSHEKVAKVGKQKVSDKPTKSDDTLNFKATDEVWIDELENYQVSIKDCPPLKGSKL